MTDYTIITTDSLIRLDVHHYAFSTRGGDLLLFGDADEDSEPVGQVPSDDFVGIVETEHLVTPSPS